MKNNNIEKILKSLLNLQLVDNKLNEIEKLKGELPIEILNLEELITKFKNKIDILNKKFEVISQNINFNKLKIKDIKKLIFKYENQHKNIKNNKEYKAINKEIDLQNLEIKILEKKILEKYKDLEIKNKNIKDFELLLKESESNLAIKKEELKSIMQENEINKKKLVKSKEKVISKIEKRFYDIYEKIKNNTKNKLAVVTIKRNACGGCFNTVPPQKQVDIKKNEKIILCEHCGRIFVGITKKN